MPKCPFLANKHEMFGGRPDITGGVMSQYLSNNIYSKNRWQNSGLWTLENIL